MEKQLTAALKSAVEAGEVAGAGVLVLKDGKEAAFCAYGMRDIENALPIERDTIFRLYSQTKPVTAAAVMLLAAQGRLDLGAWLSDYLPAFSQMNVCENGELRPAKRHITVSDLLNMTSGIPYPDNDMAGRESGRVFWETEQSIYGESPVTTMQFAQKMAEVPLWFEPGERFRYGASADILGAVVEAVSGVTFREFLMESFFEPLGMSDTDFYVPKEKQSHLAKAYDYAENGLREVQTNHLALPYKRDIVPAFQSGGAGLCSTLDDYAKFGAMLLAGGVYAGRRIMPEAAVRRLTAGGIAPALDPQLAEGWEWMRGYTYGSLMRVCRDETRTTLLASRGEYGWDGWLGTFFSNEPAHGITMVYGAQQAGVGRAGTLARRLKNIVMSHLA